MNVEALGSGYAGAGARARWRVAARPAVVLGAIVGVGFLARLAAVFLQAVPTFFPDEYIYSSLAKSIAEGGLPSIRGQVAHFPALLAPLLTAPAWLFGDPAVGYRVSLAIGAAAISTAPVPIYLLARRVGVGSQVALAVAGLSLLLPDTMWVSFLTAEAFAFPLALAAVWAGVRALDRPSPRSQALFVGLTALTTLARVQFVVLALAYAGAVLGLGLRERRLRRVLTEQRLPLGLFLAGGGAFAAVGLGYYHNVADLSVFSGAVLASFGTNVYVLLYAAGLALVPGAVLGLGLGLGRAESRSELAFALLSTGLLLCLLAEAAVYGSAVHERYSFYAVPLLGVAFARYAQRGWPHRLPHAVLAVALVAGATRLPLTILGERGESHSSVLIAVAWVRIHLGESGTASLVALAAAALAAVVAIAGSTRPRAGVVAVLAAAAVVSGATLAGSTDFVRRAADAVRHDVVPADPSWVDHAGVGRVSLVTAAGVDTSATHLELIFNRSIDRLLALPGGASPDVFAASKVRVGADGLLTAAGRPVLGPVVVDGDRSLVELQGEFARAVGKTWRLYDGPGPHRLGLYFRGRWAKGWVSPLSRIELWAPPGRTLRGTYELPLSLPAVAPATVVTVRVAGGGVQRLSIPAGGRVTVSLPLCGVTHLRASLSFSKLLLVGHDYAGARAARPVFLPGQGCAPRPRD